ncbi:MAG: VWA domain-containing protein [Vicinamibacterales bacterium]
MTVEFGAPRVLWLLALLPLVWLAGNAGLRLRSHTWSTAARLLLLLALIAGLAQPMWSRPATRTTMIYLVDGSQSVSARALEAVAQAIETTNASLRPDTWRILAFAGGVSSVTDPAALRRIATGPGTDTLAGLISPERTNLEQALASAQAEIPASSNGRIMLFSDGRQTEGDALRAAERLAASGVPVFTRPIPVRDVGDTWIEDLRVAAAPAAASITEIDVVVGSQIVQSAEIIVREGARVLARRRSDIIAGATSVRLEVSFDAPGPHLVEAVVEAGRDVVSENNTLTREVQVEPRPRLLYVQAGGGPAAPLPANPGQTATAAAPSTLSRAVPNALARAGIEITMARPEALPHRADALDRWDVVLLNNVPRATLATEAMAALGSWVEERGGGLLFAGGQAVFGEGLEVAQKGYRHTEIERVLPVTFDRDDEPAVALVIVLDRSWSMNGTAMELSKSAAEGAANTLAPSQMLGVLTFNDASNWDVPLGRVRESRPDLHDAIGRIKASGPTAIFPALRNAYDALAAVRVRAKHVILLSDGQSDPEDFEGLVRKMSAAHITVSTVALGSDADAGLLRNLANWGGGRSYVVQDAQQIPEIFVTEARNASTPEPEDATNIQARVRERAPFLEPSLTLPALRGRNLVTRKPPAIEWLSTERGDPLLTTWPVGLGRTAMFSADLDGGWTRDWIAWRGLGRLLDGTIRALAPRRTPPSALTVSAGERVGSQAQLTITLDARDRDGHRDEGLSPTVEVRSATAPLGAFPLAPVSSGRYVAHLPADLTEPLFFSVPNTTGTAAPGTTGTAAPGTTGAAAPGAAGPAASRILVVDPFAELRFSPPDASLLSAIARTTGGTFQPAAADLSRAPRTVGTSRYPLAPWLFALALLLWPVDIVLRRFQR